MFRPPPATTLGRALATKQPAQILDVLESDAGSQLLAKLSGARTVVSVPMLKDEEPVGAILIYRLEVRPTNRSS